MLRLNYLPARSRQFNYLIFLSHEIVFDDIEGFSHVRPGHSHEDQNRIHDHEEPHRFDTGVRSEPISEALILVITQTSRIRLLRCVNFIMTFLTTFVFAASTFPHIDHIAIICKYWFQCWTSLKIYLSWIWLLWKCSNRTAGTKTFYASS